jgi:L-arabinose isomerase
MRITPKIVTTSEFAELMSDVKPEEMAECVERYRRMFAVGSSVHDILLVKTAKGEAALRTLLARANSHACGLNFLELCNNERVADGLQRRCAHERRSGYAGGGGGRRWVGDAVGFGVASFSEIFSIGYADHRLLLKHWGEGNLALARAKPRLLASKFTDRGTAEFAIADFEFAPGPATLVNLNSTPEEKGQLMSISGRVTADHLPNIDGPRGVFQPDGDNVSDLLTEYACAGGSHHLALVKGAPGDVLEKACRLAGWRYRRL